MKREQFLQAANCHAEKKVGVQGKVYEKKGGRIMRQLNARPAQMKELNCWNSLSFIFAGV